MAFIPLLTIVALLSLLSVQQAAARCSVPSRRQDEGPVTPLSPAEVASFKKYTWYASTAYCLPDATLAWDCGANCDANPEFKPVASGGDGNVTQFWYVGYDPTSEEVIVGHQGTDGSKGYPIFIDLDFCLRALDSALFPGTSEPIRAHEGFQGTQSRSAPGVLAAVQTALSEYSASKVTVTGHSLGGAIALLDAVFLHLQLPSSVTVRYIGYASPRVGNKAFADYVDSLHISTTHINNKQDPVPVLPPDCFDYVHVSGEIHIKGTDEWVHCPGQDNPSDQCSAGSVNFANYDPTQHPGPYDGVTMVC